MCKSSSKYMKHIRNIVWAFKVKKKKPNTIFLSRKQAEREGRTEKEIRRNFVWTRLAKGARSFHTHYILKRHTMALFMSSGKPRDGRSWIELSWRTLPPLHIHVWYDVDESICLRFDPEGHAWSLWHHLLFFSETCPIISLIFMMENVIMSFRHTGVLLNTGLHLPLFGLGMSPFAVCKHVAKHTRKLMSL